MSTQADLQALGYSVITDGDMPYSREASIVNNGAYAVDLGAITKLNSLIIDNDETSAGRDLTVTINGVVRTVKAGETFTVANSKITSILLANTSGNTINYRIFGFGVN